VAVDHQESSGAEEQRQRHHDGEEMSVIVANSKGVRRRVIATSVAAVVFTALAVAGSATWAAEQPTASMVSARADKMASRKDRNDVGIRGHGFVTDNGVFTTIDAPRAGVYTVAFGIDDQGRTVGGYVDRKGTLHGFLRDQGEFTVIDFPGAQATVAARINARGQIVGAYSENSNAPVLSLPHGFLLEDGAFTPIDTPGARRTQPFGINNRGQIVGEYVDAEGRSHGFLLENGVFTTIDAPGRASTIAFDINDNGQIVGVSYTARVGSGFLREANGAFTTIAVPNAVKTLPYGINNRGQIVGGYDEGQQTGTQGFLLDAGVFTPINSPAQQATRSSSTSTMAVNSSAPTTSPATATSRTDTGTSQRSTIRTLLFKPASLSASTTAGRSWAITSIPTEETGAFCWTSIASRPLMFPALGSYAIP
jgi:probable HAF family extracellular repeat protein